MTPVPRLKPSVFSANITEYELLSDIGGVDDVSYLCLARFIPTGEYVALKYTDLSLSPDYEYVEELTRTVKNASLCSHPNILPYFLSFIENERLWSVTFPVEPGSCRGIMKECFADGFSEDVVATILKEALNAIVYLHENHMIHNDIRSDNILLDNNGEVRVTGLRQLACLSQGGEYVKSVFSLVGDNIEWAAPEVMAQNSNYNEKVDIYSFGITAIELAYNQTPFDEWPPLKILLSKLEFDCPAIKTNKVLSKHFYRMVNACIRKDPRQRPTAAELLRHPFFKSAKNAVHLQKEVTSKIRRKLTAAEEGSTNQSSGQDAATS
ncbi:kinase-like domain-containing protein [Zopfochytrium polystomum]|nr:kinase-like domain-containing protein [Zopfochytrium polystomum]